MWPNLQLTTWTRLKSQRHYKSLLLKHLTFTMSAPFQILPRPPSRSIAPFYLKSLELIRRNSLFKQANKTQIHIQHQHRQFAVPSSPTVRVWQLWHVHNTILPQTARSICRMQARPTCASSFEFRTLQSFAVDRSLASNYPLTWNTEDPQLVHNMQIKFSDWKSSGTTHLG